MKRVTKSLYHRGATEDASLPSLRVAEAPVLRREIKVKKINLNLNIVNPRKLSGIPYDDS